MIAALKKKYAKFWRLYIFLLIPLTYLFIFRYYPMIGAQIAFRKYSIRGGVWGSPWVGFDNFIKFLTAYQFRRVLVNTLSLSLYSLLASFPIPIIFALMLNVVTNRRLKKSIQTVSSLPNFISIVVLVGMIRQFFNPLVGIYGVIYGQLTGGGTVPDILGSPAAFGHIYVLSGVWQTFGYSAIIYLAALSNVSEELHEASQIDGASRFQRVLHIDFPAILPTVTIMLILRMGFVMNVGFEKVFLLQNPMNISVSEIISTFVYKKGLGSGMSNDYSYAAAIDIFNSVINMILITVVNAISDKLGETSLW